MDRGKEWVGGWVGGSGDLERGSRGGGKGGRGRGEGGGERAGERGEEGGGEGGRVGRLAPGELYDLVLTCCVKINKALDWFFGTQKSILWFDIRLIINCNSFL